MSIKAGDTIRFREYLVGVGVNDPDEWDVGVEEGEQGWVVHIRRDGRTIVHVGTGDYLFMTSAIMRQELVATG